MPKPAQLLNHLLRDLPEKEFNLFKKSLLKSKSRKPNSKMILILDELHNGEMNDRQIMAYLDIREASLKMTKSRILRELKVFTYRRMNFRISKYDLTANLAPANHTQFVCDRESLFENLKNVARSISIKDDPFETFFLSYQLSSLSRKQDDPKKHYYRRQFYKSMMYVVMLLELDDLFWNFFEKLSIYFHSRKNEDLGMVHEAKNEIDEMREIYNSIYAEVYSRVTDIACKLFLPYSSDQDNLENDLEKLKNLLDRLPKNPKNEYILHLYHYFCFEHYRNMGPYIYEEKYYSLVNAKLRYMLRNQFDGFLGNFLISKAEHLTDRKQSWQFYHDLNHAGYFDRRPPVNDNGNYISYMISLSVAMYYGSNFDEAYKLINRMRRRVKLYKFPHANIEIRLYMALLESLCGNDAACERSINNALNYITRMGLSETYEHAVSFANLIKESIKIEKGGSYEELVDSLTAFNLVNHQRKDHKILTWLRTDFQMMERIVYRVRHYDLKNNPIARKNHLKQINKAS